MKYSFKVRNTNSKTVYTSRMTEEKNMLFINKIHLCAQ